MQECNRQKQKFLCFQVQLALFNKHGRNAEEKAAARQGALGHGHPLLKRSSTGLKMTGLKKSCFHHFQLRLSITKCLEANQRAKFVRAVPDIRLIELAQK